MADTPNTPEIDQIRRTGEWVERDGLMPTL